jgi:hypothetical protein
MRASFTVAEAIQALPVWWANAASFVLFAAIALACLTVPRERVFSDAPDRAGWRDLRWWAVALAAVQIGIYAVFS